MITVKQSGNFKNASVFLEEIKRNKTALYKILRRYGEEGVLALSRKTPANTGKTADSWGYEIHESRTGIELVWTNSNESNSIPIALLIQYGHATKNGGYVKGVDYINPALSDVFKKMSNELWKEVTK